MKRQTTPPDSFAFIRINSRTDSLLSVRRAVRVMRQPMSVISILHMPIMPMLQAQHIMPFMIRAIEHMPLIIGCIMLASWASCRA